jgi:DNA-binding SARP family transcriptional activator
MSYWDALACAQVDPRQAQGGFDRAFQIFSAANDAAGQALCAAAVIAVNIAEWGNFGQRGYWFQLLAKLMVEPLTFPARGDELRVWSALLLACSYERRRVPIAAAALERVRDLCRDTAISPGERLAAATNLLFHVNQTDGIESARDVLQEFATLAASPEASPLQRATWHWFEQTHCYYAAEFVTSAKLFRTCRSLLAEAGLPLTVRMIDLLDAWTQLSCGDVTTARNYLDRLAREIDRTQPNDVALHGYLTAWLQLLEGEPHAALEYAEKSVPFLRDVAGSASVVPIFCLYSLALAESRRETGVLEAAEEAVEASSGGIDISSFTAQLFRAEALRRKSASRDELHAALSLAFSTGRRGGFMNTLLWIAPMMSRLCAQALAMDLETSYVERLIRRRELPPPDVETEIWPRPVRIYTLGRFDVVINGQRLQSSGKAQRRPLELLKAIICFGGRNVATEKLAAELWPNAEGDAAYRAFKVSLHRLRRLLGSDGLVRMENAEVTLDPGKVWVDTWAFERWFGELSRTPSTAQADVAAGKILSLYQGAFLGATDTTWALAARERLRSKYVRGVLLAGESQRRRGELQQAADGYERGVEIEPAAEGLYIDLIRC